jgi:crotonobetainyl-CoA:carnitine CoA-transferase CaiB-like acyl-CoA transferase
MTAVMQGVRILEVADHTFVPAASAALADYGAEVIKIEHVERGDAMRGLAKSGLAVMGTTVHVILEHSNRGKKSLGLDLTQDEGVQILYEIAKTCDVFLTNRMPSVRQKLRIDLEHLRAANPDIIYVRGTGNGDRGPEADKGSYDQLSFWCRPGVASAMAPPEPDFVPPPPGPAFGDSIGAFTIAGGIMGALYHREKTGEATVVDVSLLSTAMWSIGATIALSKQLGFAWTGPKPGGGPATLNPLVASYQTSDGRWLFFSCLQGDKYWPDACRVIGEPELGTDERFKDNDALLANGNEAIEILKEAFASKTLAEWRVLLDDFSGQWAVVQDVLEATEDVQVVANGLVQEVEAADGTPFELIAAPVQYDNAPAVPKRAPEFNEHGDEILGSLGYDMDQIIELKVRGVVT